MYLSEIRGEVRRYLAETSASASFFSDADINASINEGLKDMCIKADVYVKTHTITVATGQAAYNLPWFVLPREQKLPTGQDVLQLKTVLNHNNVALDPIPIEHIGRVYTGISGLPLSYFISQVAITPTTWTIATAYVVFPVTGVVTLTYVKPSTVNGCMYECITAGTSHAATEPTWTTVIGSTQAVDGTVYWKCREGMTNLYTINFYSTPTTVGAGVGTYTIYYNAIDEGLYTDADTPNIPPNKQHYLILFACFRCAMKAKDYQLAIAYMTDYSRGLGLQMPNIAAPQGGGSAA